MRGRVRFSNSNRIIPSDYRILLLLKMPIPSRIIKICANIKLNKVVYIKLLNKSVCQYFFT